MAKRIIVTVAKLDAALKQMAEEQYALATGRNADTEAQRVFNVIDELRGDRGAVGALAGYLEIAFNEGRK